MKTFRILLVVLISLVISACAEENVTELDINKMTERGMVMYALTDGRAVWAVYRTHPAIKFIESTEIEFNKSKDPTTVNNIYRSVNKDIFVVFGGCPDIKEIPEYYPNKGFVCPKSGALFDTAGRPLNQVSKGQPMAIPKHYFKDKMTLVVYTNQDG